MPFILLETIPKNVIDKVQQDSGLTFSTWPKSAIEPNWLWLDGNSLSELHKWLTPRCAEKLQYVDDNTDKARKVLGLTIAGDQQYYLKVFALIEPYLRAEKKMHPVPKFSVAIANSALHGFNSPIPENQPTFFGLAEHNLSLDCTLTPDHLFSVFVTFTDKQRTLTKQFSFKIPLNAPPAFIKPFLIKYLTDPKYTYTDGELCYQEFAELQKLIKPE